MGFPGGSVVKNPPVLQAVWGRFPEEGNGNPLQYSCLENAIATVHGVTKSQTQLNDWSDLIWYPLYGHFIQSFIIKPMKFYQLYHKLMLVFIKCCFCIFWDDHMTCVLQFAIVVYHINWFADILTWSWCMVILLNLVG